MKTIRTILATLATVLLGFALVAWFSVRRNAAFIQRTIYQGFDQTFVVALVMGCAFLLIAIILTVAIVSTDDDDEEDEEEDFRPRHQTRPPASRGEQPYRRVSRSVEQSRTRREEYDEYPRSRREEPRPVRRRPEEAPRRRPEESSRRRERMAERPDEIDLERREASVKKKAPKPVAPVEEAPEEVFEEIAEAPKAETPEAAEPETETEAGEPQGAPEAEEAVRCIFCGGKMSRSEEICPHCGKKR